jgi:hypothetical protein
VGIVVVVEIAEVVEVVIEAVDASEDVVVGAADTFAAGFFFLGFSSGSVAHCVQDFGCDFFLSPFLLPPLPLPPLPPP